jgi:deoxyribodipyrimidine photo-lyase
MDRALVIYRNDLRIHDHPALHHAMKNHDEVLAIYVLDKALLTKTQYGFKKIGPFRAKFLVEGLNSLSENLNGLNVPFFIYLDDPITRLKTFIETYEITSLYYHQLVGQEEEAFEKTLHHAFSHLTIHPYFERTLLNPNLLPFNISEMPDVFTKFKEAVEASLKIEPLLSTPTPQKPMAMKPVKAFDCYHDLGFTEYIESRFKGGEFEALKRLEYYFFESEKVKTYKLTRNGLLFDDDSSKFSPYLSQGSLSPRMVYFALKEFEKKIVQNESTYWLFFELLWRDFFIFIHMKYGNKLFQLGGIKALCCDWVEDPALVEKVFKAKTGYPLIDASIKEMHQTGFMSNRGRQNVASFFTKNLSLNWLIGASMFEMMLIDYDVSSNYGNWAYIAGVGNDNMPFRFFNLEKQGETYDQEATYAKTYLPSLSKLPSHLVYKIHRLSQLDLAPYNIILGKDYPKRMIDFDQSIEKRKNHFKEILKKDGK